jgi:hypothetical protein
MLPHAFFLPASLLSLLYFLSCFILANDLGGYVGTCVTGLENVWRVGLWSLLESKYSWTPKPSVQSQFSFHLWALAPLTLALQRGGHMDEAVRKYITFDYDF